MKTFNGDNNLKESLIKKLKHHQELDTFIQGNWLDKESGKVEGNGFRGCFYGCTMQTDKNALSKFSGLYSIDLFFTYLTENIFEGLPIEDAKLFPLQIIEALPVGLDLNKIKSEWFQIILTDQLRFTKEGDKQYKAIQQCINLFSTPFDEIEWSAAWSAWSAARSAARSAESAAWSAAGSAARSAESAAWSAAGSAWSAARSAARSAESAAWSAAGSAWSAESAAKKKHYQYLRDTLINILIKY